MKPQWLKAVLIALLLLIAPVACSEVSPDTEITRAIDENGKPTFLSTDVEDPVPTKDDSATGHPGLATSVDDEPTAVWEVKNAWTDTATAAAKQAGIAWPADSGLSWEEKYQRWVASMEPVGVLGSRYGDETYQLTTPWGKTLPAPVLECAESAIFLRVTFASWYQLPFFLEAADADGRVYFGHFGMRRASGRFGKMPNFRDRYEDHTARASVLLREGEWPSDASLRAKSIPGSFDDAQPMIGEDAHAGAYFDEIYLNKRVGHFMVLTLAWFGSVNLSDSANTFNIKPSSIAAGDVLIERWQKVGIGHALIVMRSEEMGETTIDGETVAQLEVEVASGSMPRRQPVWESPGASKRYFSLDATGGPDSVQFGGGIKRWRAAQNINGRWTNVVIPAHSNDWINSRDKDALAERIERFEEILVELSPDQKRDVLLGVIESKRQHLRSYPASCSARINREAAFDALYELMRDEFDMTSAQVDAEHRTYEDYVFAELDYADSKTCCWNRSTSAMYDVVMDLNVQRQTDSMSCLEPVVFMNRDDESDGYEVFRAHATTLGLADAWQPWSEDESCPQRDVPADSVSASDVTAYCALPEGSVAPALPAVEVPALVLDFDGVEVPDDDETAASDSASLDAAGEIARASLSVDIRHSWIGDLDIEITHPDGARLRLKEADSARGDGLKKTFELEDFTGKTAAGMYTITLRDRAAQDTGALNSAQLKIELR